MVICSNRPSNLEPCGAPFLLQNTGNNMHYNLLHSREIGTQWSSDTHSPGELRKCNTPQAWKFNPAQCGPESRDSQNIRIRGQVGVE